MKMRVGDKAQRILGFLMGFRDGAIAAVMEEHGMTADDFEEGWTLLRGVGQRRLATRRSPEEQSLRKELDGWENHYYPIIQATLERSFREVHDYVFLNLRQVGEDQVVWSVDALITRLDEVADPNGPVGEVGPKALALLERRKVGESALAVARELLEKLRKFDPDKKAMRAAEEEELALQAEQEAWAWYLEWSKIARVAIKNRSMLRKLGFLDHRGNPVALPDEVAPPEGEETDQSASADDPSDGTALPYNPPSNGSANSGDPNDLPFAVAPGEEIPEGLPGASPFVR